MVPGRRKEFVNVFVVSRLLAVEQWCTADEVYAHSGGDDVPVHSVEVGNAQSCSPFNSSGLACPPALACGFSMPSGFSFLTIRGFVEKMILYETRRPA